MNACMLGICSVSSLLALSACATAPTFRIVERTPGAGVVAIPSAQDIGREKAEEYMKSQCPSGYDVQKEAEAVIGSDTVEGHKHGFLWTPPANTTSTTQKTEWRIEFKCKGAAPDAPADQNAKKSSQTHTFIVRY